MKHTLYTLCPNCGDPRATVLELLKPTRSVLVNCDCGEVFAVHLRVSVHAETVPVPRPHWSRPPSLSFEI